MYLLSIVCGFLWPQLVLIHYNSGNTTNNSFLSKLKSHSVQIFENIIKDMKIFREIKEIVISDNLLFYT